MINLVDHVVRPLTLPVIFLSSTVGDILIIQYRRLIFPPKTVNHMLQCVQLLADTRETGHQLEEQAGADIQEAINNL